MTSCHTCGREIAAGSVCPYCGAHNAPVPFAPQGAEQLPQGTRRFDLSVTQIIVGINVLVFVAMVATGSSLTSPTRDQLLRWGANWGPLSLGAQPWRILTSN